MEGEMAELPAEDAADASKRQRRFHYKKGRRKCSVCAMFSHILL